jgi:hypothetical protein
MSFEKPWGNYLLEAIVETSAPHGISFWPQTIAWKIIFILLIIFAIKKSYQTWRTYQANAYRREALAWLAQCSLKSEEDIRQLPALLRKTALLANDVSLKNEGDTEGFTEALARRQEITQLTGKSWAIWLDKHCSNSQFTKVLTTSPCDDLLAQLAYIPVLNINNNEFDTALKQLSQQIALWIKYHQLNTDTLTVKTGEQA